MIAITPAIVPKTAPKMMLVSVSGTGAKERKRESELERHRFWLTKGCTVYDKKKKKLRKREKEGTKMRKEYNTKRERDRQINKQTHRQKAEWAIILFSYYHTGFSFQFALY